MICLFDRNRQHIVAEAVRPSPSSSGKQGVPLALGGNTVPRGNPVCEHVLANHTGDVTTGLPVLAVPDLDADTRFCHRKDKEWRFYAGVPIRSPAGLNIGIYCVIDTEPRLSAPTEEETRFLQNMSSTVMNYLEFRRSNRWCRREDRMTCGLGSFVEGKATISPPPERAGRASCTEGSGVVEGSLNKRLHALRIPDSEERASNHNVPAVSRPSGRSQDGPATLPTASTDSQGTPGRSQTDSADTLQNDVECVFSKAANIIRESVQVEGAVFLDASINSFGGLVDKSPLSGIPEGLRSSVNLGVNSDFSSQPPGPDEPTCRVLGFSTSDRSSINGDAPSPDHASLPERFLQTLLQQYPRGHIINFEVDGDSSNHPNSAADITPPASPLFPIPDAADGEASAATSHRDWTAASSILKIFPGARSVAIVPLWDPQRNRLFAGGFVWTKTPSRIFTVENELNYLKVFGLAAMAEVARLNTRAAVKTKTDILGSISHELRSPLHGVVGAVELLRDTTLDGFQEGIVNAIETSGKTLLDTIDHVSDTNQTLMALPHVPIANNSSLVVGLQRDQKPPKRISRRPERRRQRHPPQESKLNRITDSQRPRAARSARPAGGGGRRERQGRPLLPGYVRRAIHRLGHLSPPAPPASCAMAAQVRLPARREMELRLQGRSDLPGYRPVGELDIPNPPRRVPAHRNEPIRQLPQVYYIWVHHRVSPPGTPKARYRRRLPGRPVRHRLRPRHQRDIPTPPPLHAILAGGPLLTRNGTWPQPGPANDVRPGRYR